MEILKQKIPFNVYNKLLEANIDSLHLIIMKEEIVLCQLTRLSREEIKYVVQEAVDITLKNKFKPASNVLEWPRLTTGCTVINSIIRGGIPVNGITEIVGSSGVGKTQLCLQLALTVQFPTNRGGLNRGAVYICTEDIFPSKRLHQLSNLFRLHNNLENLQLEDNIFLEHITDFEQLQRCLRIRLPRLLSHYKVGLLIIDSIAGVFRSETVGVNYTSRSQEFVEVASQLNKLGDENGIAIVVVNQVTDNAETGKTEPCLGLAWSNLVTCRFSIHRFSDNIRVFNIVFSPDLQSASCKFIIKDFGLIGTE